MAIGATDLAILILVAAVGLSVIVGLVYLTIRLVKKMTE
jgi:hypothetical protein